MRASRGLVLEARGEQLNLALGSTTTSTGQVFAPFL